MRIDVRSLSPYLAVLVLAVAASARADAVCYRLPFSNPDLADGWGSTCCGRTNPHRGVDFPQGEGTPIPAVADGVVRLRVWNGCLGNVVVIGHADGMFSGYSHMREGSPLAEGTVVVSGQIVGRVGNTGSCSLGAHLHLTMSDHLDGYWTGTTVDPHAYITSHTTCRTCVAEVCNGADDDCDSRTDEGDLCELALLHEQPSAYAGPRSTDLNADGRVDLCARSSAGVTCWPAGEAGWSAPWAPIPWSDASGWNDLDNYATLRMGDVDGDHRADVCARSNSDFLCALSTGSGFAEHTTWRAALSDANGWSNPQYYTTFRLADVDADGKDDLCARDSEGFGCWLSNGTTFDRRILGPRWSNASGWGVARYYGTIRMADLNGDRRADVCARSSAGVECWLSDGDGFPARVAGPAWSDASGWGAMPYWSTLRIIDFDGDGLGDLCARASSDLRCVRGTGSGFSDTVIVAALSDASGWNDVSNYATLRTGDVDGDGGHDLCLRSNTEVLCFAWDAGAPEGGAFRRLTGPEWSDASGWGLARYHQTIRLADFDGDGLEDVCARASTGWRCHPSVGDGFGDAVTLDALTEASGWGEHRFWSTILSAGTGCRPAAESCNGRDDDCDGEVDEHATIEECNGLDDDCDGEQDEGISCDLDASIVGDGGVSARDGSVAARDGGRPGGPIASGCSCRAGGRGAPLAGALGLIALGLIAARRPRPRASLVSARSRRSPRAR